MKKKITSWNQFSGETRLRYVTHNKIDGSLVMYGKKSYYRIYLN